MDIIKDILNKIKNNRKVIMLVCSIALVITILVNSTYSLLVKTDETNAMTYATGNLQITSNAVDNSVTLTNSLPMSDEDGLNSSPFKFQITNVGNLTFEFKIKLLATTSENLIEAQYIKVSVNGNAPVTLASLTKGIILDEVMLKPNENVDVTLRVWLDINTPNTQIGKTFNAKLVTEGQAIYDYVSFTPGIDNSGANFPQLTDGLVPVVYDEEVMEWVRASTSNDMSSPYSWYDYDEKKWANAVLVKESGHDLLILDPAYDLHDYFDESVTYYSVSGQGDPISFKTDDLFGDDTVSFDFKLSTSTYSGTYDYDRVEYINGDPTSFFNDCVQILVDGITYPVSYEENNISVNSTSEFGYDITGTFFMELPYNDGEPHEIIISYIWDETYGTYVEISNFSTSYSDETLLRVNLNGWSTNGHNDLAVVYVSSSYSLNLYEDGYGGYFSLDNAAPIFTYNSQELVGMFMCRTYTETVCDSIYKITDVDENGIIKKVAIFAYYDSWNERDYLYSEDSVGTIIRKEDILAHYVWIPRFKYKVWNIDKELNKEMNDDYNPKDFGIDVMFENGIDSTGTVVCDDYDFTVLEGEGLSETCFGTNGVDYYTHPAFTFGDKDVAGIWVGKYEFSPGNEEFIKPGLRGDYYIKYFVGDFHDLAKGMQVSNNMYGLSTNLAVVDSHVITNMEWGAMSYLTHSKYGMCGDLGCSLIEKNDSSYEGEDSVVVTGKGGTTTGNVYGVYDTVGGYWETVMANSSSVGGSYEFDSWFTNLQYDDSFQKYITTYSYGTTYDDQDAYNRTRLGDAIGEVNNWYYDEYDSSDLYEVPHSDEEGIGEKTWIRRSSYGVQEGTTIFHVFSNVNEFDFSTRFVLTPYSN